MRLQQSLTLEILECLARHHIAGGVLKLLLELGLEALRILCYRDLLPHCKMTLFALPLMYKSTHIQQLQQFLLC